MRSKLDAAFDFRVSLVEFLHLAARPKEPDWVSSVSYNRLDYAEPVRRLLAPHGSHEAAKLLRAAFDEGLDHSQLLQLGLFSLDGDLSYPGGAPRWSPWGMERPGGVDRIRSLLEAMSAFVRDARLPEFFVEHEGVYADYKRRYAEELAEQDHVAVLEEYAGLTPDAPYRILLAPFLERETSHVDVGRGKAVTFYPPDRVRGGKPVWAVREKGPVFWHELGHWILDPLAERHEDKIKELEPLYPSKVGECRGSLRMCVIEHAAQGLGVRMCDWAKATGRAHGGRRLDPEDLPLIDAVAAGLEGFEADRERFKTIREYYPVWLETFKTAEKKPWWRFF